MVGRARACYDRRGANQENALNQNTLYLVVGALAVAVVAMGIYIWREEAKPDGVELRIDDSGISVQEK